MRNEKQTLAAFRRLRVEIDKDRKDEINRHRRAIKAAGLVRLPKDTRPLNILAEGDSWFLYPFYDAIPARIVSGAARTPFLLNLAHWGDVATEMLGYEQRKRIIEHLRHPANGPFDAFLFSAGGNDFAGNPFCLWLRQRTAKMKPADAVYRPRFDALLAVVRAAYEDLIDICRTYQPDCVLFFHGYDYALPDGRRICPGVGPWLEPSLTLKGWTDPEERNEIVRIMLRSMGDVLTDLAKAHPGRVVVVPTLGTLRQAPEDWSNEMHPRASGFETLAGVFLRSLHARFSGRI